MPCYADMTIKTMERLEKAHKRIFNSIEKVDGVYDIDRDKRMRCSQLLTRSIDRKKPEMIFKSYEILKDKEFAFTINEKEIRSVYIKIEDC